jgi:hypothetical protein
MRFQSLAARLKELEDSQGFVTLDDGSKFSPDCSGIRIYRESIRKRRDLGRSVVLSDFSEEEQHEISQYAKWHPDAGTFGGLSVNVADICRAIVARSLSSS